MTTPVRCLILAVAAALGCISLGAAAPADDAAAVQEKWEAAKHAYNLASEKYTKVLTEQLEKAEEAARKAGDKKALAQVKAEQKAFEKKGYPPASVPVAPRQDLLAARSKLDMAYTDAAKGYIRLKMDEKAEEMEKQQQEFVINSGVLAGKWTYLAALKHTDLKHEGFSNNGIVPRLEIPLQFQGEPTPHSIYLHPPGQGFSTMTYQFARKWSAFRATVGLPKIDETTQNPASKITFEVLGDGKSLWKSKPADKIEEFQSCQVWIQGVKAITLRVHCPGINAFAQGVWFEPILIEP